MNEKIRSLFYDEDGNRRGLVEGVFIIALMVITGEVPEFSKLNLDSDDREDEDVYKIPMEKRYEDMEKAVVYCRVLGITSHKELRQMMVKSELSDDDKEKLLFINRQLNLAMDKKYCCENVYERVFDKEEIKQCDYVDR